MEKIQVIASCKQWFGEQGYSIDEQVEISAGWWMDISALRDKERWLVSVIGDHQDEQQYLYDFDGSVNRLITTSAQLGREVFMGVALPFSSTEHGHKLSYRRALKKYSNSIIFVDLNISLLLVRDDDSLEVIAPNLVNPFLRELNRLIDRRGRES